MILADVHRQIYVVVCGESPAILHGSAVSLPNFPVNVGEQITYTCSNGYRFRDGSYSKTIECEQGGWWSLITNCIRKIAFCLHFPEFSASM